MKLQYFMLGMLLAIALINGVSIFIGDQRANSGVDVNSTELNPFNETNLLMDEISAQSTTSRDTEIATTGTFALQTSGYSTLLRVWDSYAVASTLITNGLASFGLNEFVQVYILGALTVVLMFAILAAIYFGRTV